MSQSLSNSQPWLFCKPILSMVLHRNVWLVLIDRSHVGCLNKQLYPSQTKILEGGTKEEMRILKALLKGVSTQFGPCSIEKSVEHPDIIFCSSFQNLRLGSINFKQTTLPLPNEDFGRRNKRGTPEVRSTFQGREYSIWATNHWKVYRKSGFPLLFILPKSSFGRGKLYAPQTKILEGGTRDEMRMFDALFNG